MMLKRGLALLLLLVCVSGCALSEEVPPFGDFSDVFADRFLPPGSAPVQEPLFYQSENIRIEITPIRRQKTDIYVADIYVRSTEHFQRAFSQGKWRKPAEKVADMAQEHQAVLAMTGDNGHNLATGWVVGNGVYWRQTKSVKRDMCILYRSGVMETIELQQVDNDLLREKAARQEFWHCFLFGPALLDAQGKAKSTFNSTVNPANPRSAIGYFEPGHYCFVQIDGRGAPSKLEPGKKSTGLRLNELSLFMEELGCTAAYNLDGGQSSMMYFDGAVLSSPYKNGRKTGDIVLIRELETPEALPLDLSDEEEK